MGKIQYTDENGVVQLRDLTAAETAQQVKDEAAWGENQLRRDYLLKRQPAVDAFLEDRMLARADDDDAPQELKDWKAARDALPPWQRFRLR